MEKEKKTRRGKGKKQWKEDPSQNVKRRAIEIKHKGQKKKTIEHREDTIKRQRQEI